VISREEIERVSGSFLVTLSFRAKHISRGINAAANGQAAI